jgi:hypothetical protein
MSASDQAFYFFSVASCGSPSPTRSAEGKNQSCTIMEAKRDTSMDIRKGPRLYIPDNLDIIPRAPLS